MDYTEGYNIVDAGAYCSVRTFNIKYYGIILNPIQSQILDQIVDKIEEVVNVPY